MTDTTDRFPRPDPDRWQSRDTLLRDQADAVTAWSRTYNGVWALLRLVLAAAVLTFGLLLAGFAASESIDDGGASGLIVALILLVITVWPGRMLLKAARQRDDMIDTLAAWQDVDASDRARALPGNPAADLRTPWDARFDSDFDAVVSRNAGQTRIALGENGTLLRSVLGGIGLAIGLVLVGVAVTSFDRPVVAVGAALGGLTMVGAAGAAVWAAMTYTYRTQVRENRMAAERPMLEAARNARGLGEAVAMPAVNPVAKVAFGGVLALIVVIVAVRVAAASPVALAIVVAILVLAVAALIAVWLRQRAADVAHSSQVAGGIGSSDAVFGGRVRHARYGLTTDSGRPGALVVAHDQVTLHGNGTAESERVTVTRGDLIAVVPLPARGVWRRRGLALVLSDESAAVIHTRFARPATAAVRTWLQRST